MQYIRTIKLCQVGIGGRVPYELDRLSRRLLGNPTIIAVVTHGYQSGIGQAVERGTVFIIPDGGGTGTARWSLDLLIARIVVNIAGATRHRLAIDQLVRDVITKCGTCGTGVLERAIADSIIRKGIGIATGTTASLGLELVSIIIGPGQAVAAGFKHASTIADIVILVIIRRDGGSGRSPVVELGDVIRRIINDRCSRTVGITLHGPSTGNVMAEGRELAEGIEYGR